MLMIFFAVRLYVFCKYDKIYIRGEKMKYIKGFKFRIYPNALQQKIINQTLGCARFVYNHFLAIRQDSWKEKHESVTYVKSNHMLTELKRHPAFV